MKRILLALLLVGVVALVTMAPGGAVAQSNGIVVSATGGAHITNPADIGENRTFSFSARKYADGSVKGEAQLNARNLSVVNHLQIDCLRVVGNIVHMSGVVTRTNDPSQGPVGELLRFAVQDNGEGKNSPPDKITTLPPNPNLETCENSTLTPNRDVERGNVQVHLP
jgi:hypothetical protein